MEKYVVRKKLEIIYSILYCVYITGTWFLENTFNVFIQTIVVTRKFENKNKWECLPFRCCPRALITIKNPVYRSFNSKHDGFSSTFKVFWRSYEIKTNIETFQGGRARKCETISFIFSFDKHFSWDIVLCTHANLLSTAHYRKNYFVLCL